MQSRTERSLEEIAAHQVWISVEVFAKAFPWLLCMDQPDGYSLADQFRQYSKEWPITLPGGYMHVFDVGCSDPQKLGSRRHQLLNNALVDLLVEKEFEHGGASPQKEPGATRSVEHLLVRRL